MTAAAAMTVAQHSVWDDVAFAVFAVAAVLSGWRVFRTDSMVRATFLLLASFANVGAILLLLTAEYLGFLLVFMMTVEMTVMVVFMVMFMMNPAGLNPMNMVHQERVAAAAGLALFAGLSAVALARPFPSRPVGRSLDVISRLGDELMGPSMLIFESAGVTLLATMIVAVVLSAHTNRYGIDDDGSLPPVLDPVTGRRPEDALDTRPSAMHGHDHGGHG